MSRADRAWRRAVTGKVESVSEVSDEAPDHTRCGLVWEHSKGGGGDVDLRS
jgi:hypothetical protein